MRRGPERLLLIGLVVLLLGRLIDLWWHSTHPEFETAGDQIRAHAVVWSGAVLMLVASARAVASGLRDVGYLAVLIGSVGYAAVAVWHFYEHSQQRDPDLPHVLLLVTNVIMIAGAAWAWAAPRLRSRGAVG